MDGLYKCVTPLEHCSGTMTSGDKLSQGIRGRGIKTHKNGREANACYGRYLISQGYEQVSPREYKKEEQSTMTLPKPNRRPDFRPGKLGERKMPKHKTGGMIVG